MKCPHCRRDIHRAPFLDGAVQDMGNAARHLWRKIRRA